MNKKLSIILSLILFLGFGYASTLPSTNTAQDEYSSVYPPSPFLSHVEVGILLLLFFAVISHWFVQRKKEPGVKIVYKIFGSLLAPASLLSVFLLVLNKVQRAALVADNKIFTPKNAGILGETMWTNEAASKVIFVTLILSIIYIGLKRYLAAAKKNVAVDFWKTFAIGILLSIVSVYIMSYVIHDVWGSYVLLSYLVMGGVASLIISFTLHLHSQVSRKKYG